jgi:simple sugar transport system permease protein
MYIYLNYSKHGYEIAVVGESERTARYVGIKVERVIVRTMLLSGALCGLAGLLLVGGTSHTLTPPSWTAAASPPSWSPGSPSSTPYG